MPRISREADQNRSVAALAVRIRAVLTAAFLSIVAGVSGGGCRHGAAWNYHVTVDDRSTEFTVKACNDGPWPSEFIPGDASTSTSVERVWVSPHGRGLPRSARGVSTAGLGRRECIAYTIDPPDDASVFMMRTSSWLWRPATFPEHFKASVRFTLPPHWHIGAPWPRIAGARGRDPTFKLDRTAFRWLSMAVFGEFEPQHFRWRDTQVELVVAGSVAASPSDLRAWIEDSLRTASSASSQGLPPALHVVVVPLAGTHEDISFGLATRGGGAAVLFYLEPDATAEALYGNWTSVHELLHHTMPFFDDPWLAEGWTSYLTEIALTRGGHRTEREGWQALYDAFERGRSRSADGQSLAHASQTMHERHAYQRVYWGGAAIALAVDLHLRLAVGSDLEHALAELQRCFPTAMTRVSSVAAMSCIDRWLGSNDVSLKVRQLLSVPTFPPVEGLLATLGVNVRDGVVQLDDDHPHADHRRSIMAPRGNRGPTPRRGGRTLNATRRVPRRGPERRSRPRLRASSRRSNTSLPTKRSHVRVSRASSVLIRRM